MRTDSEGRVFVDRGAPCAGCNQPIWFNIVMLWDYDRTYQMLFHRRCALTWRAAELVGRMSCET